MPIALSCHTCGKQLKAKDESAGKKIKCPGCATVLSVPALEEPAEAPPPPPPSAAAKPIVLSCGCGKKFQVKAELAGKAVKCPACQKPVKVPGGAPAPAIPPAPVRKAPPPPMEDDDFNFMNAPPAKPSKKAPPPPPPDDDDEDDNFSFKPKTPAKKGGRPLASARDDDDEPDDFKPTPKPKKKSSKLLYVMFGVMLVLGGVAGAWIMGVLPLDKWIMGAIGKGETPPAKLPEPGARPPVTPVAAVDLDLEYVPRDASVVVTMKLGEFAASPAVKLDKATRVALIDKAKAYGFEFEDIERITLFAFHSMSGPPEWGAVLLTKKPAADVVSSHVKTRKSMPDEAKRGDMPSIYSQDGFAVCAVEEKVVLAGHPTLVTKFAGKPEPEGDLKDLLAEWALTKKPFAVLAPTGMKMAAVAQAFPPPAISFLTRVQQSFLTFDTGETGLELEARFQTADEEKAVEAKQKLDNLIEIREVALALPGFEKLLGFDKILDQATTEIEANAIKLQAKLGLNVGDVFRFMAASDSATSLPPPPDVKEVKIEKKEVSELDLIPRDAALFLQIRVGDFLAGPGGKKAADKLKAILDGLVPEDKEAPQLGDIDRILLVATSTKDFNKNKSGFVFIRGKKSLEAVARKIAMDMTADEEKVLGKSLFKKDDLGICIYDKTGILFGKLDVVRAVLDQLPEPGGLDAAIQEAGDVKKHIVLGVGPGKKILDESDLKPDEDKKDKEAFADALSTFVTLHETPKGIEIKFKIKAVDAEKAQELVAYYAEKAKDVQKIPDAMWKKRLEEVLKTAKVEPVGDVVTGEFLLADFFVADIVDVFLQFMGPMVEEKKAP